MEAADSLGVGADAFCVFVVVDDFYRVVVVVDDDEGVEEGVVCLQFEF